MTDQFLLAKMRELIGAGSTIAEQPAADELVTGTITPSYLNGTFAIDARLEAKSPGLELSTYGMTAALKGAGDGQREARAWGSPYAGTLESGVGLFSKLPPGRYSGGFIVLVMVKLTESHYSAWMKNGAFEFEVK